MFESQNNVLGGDTENQSVIDRPCAERLWRCWFYLKPAALYASVVLIWCLAAVLSLLSLVLWETISDVMACLNQKWSELKGNFQKGTKKGKRQTIVSVTSITLDVNIVCLFRIKKLTAWCYWDVALYIQRCSTNRKG